MGSAQRDRCEIAVIRSFLTDLESFSDGRLVSRYLSVQRLEHRACREAVEVDRSSQSTELSDG